MKGRILVVDDEELVRIFFKKVLQEKGHEVQVVPDGRGAIELAKKKPFDIVFTDLVMPEMNGVEVCKQIKIINSKTEIVMVSGHPDKVGEYLLPFFDAGGHREILRKPLSEEEIIKAAEGIIKEITAKK
jgi:CheY-like chemotaxis protein